LTSRLSIFTKIFLAISGVAIVPLLITNALVLSNYQQLVGKIGASEISEMDPGLMAFLARESQDTYFLLSFIFLISAILVLFAALYLSRSFSQPLMTLLAATRHLAHGDFEIRVDSFRRDEVGALADGFNKMADQLEENRGRLEEANVLLENRVAQRTAELEMTNMQLEAAAQKMEEALLLKGEFLANLSHELLTPLHAMLGYSELLHEELYGEINDRQAEALAKIRRGGQSLQRLVNELINLAKMEAREMTLSVETFHPAQMLTSLVHSLRPVFAAKRLWLRCDLADNLPRLTTDRGKLQHVLYNLLSNAMKFTQSGGVTVRALLAEQDKQFVVEVSDTGIGIEPQQLHSLFDQFRKVGVAASRSSESGGLGLSLTKQLVETLGGEIGVSSEIGRGSVFRVTIPVATGLHKPNNLRVILAIDDDEDLLELLASSLEPAGFRVVQCRDGESGLAKARELNPYAVTLDIKLPHLDGWSVLQELKNDPRTADIPVIVLSVIDDRARGQSLGVNAYITKPFSRDRLIAELRALNDVEKLSVH